MKDPKRSRQFVSGRKWGKVALDFCRKSAFIPTGPASEIGWSLQSNNSGCKFSGFTARGSNGICFRNIEKAHQAVLKLRNQDAVTVEENNCQWYQWTATFFQIVRSLGLIVGIGMAFKSILVSYSLQKVTCSEVSFLIECMLCCLFVSQVPWHGLASGNQSKCWTYRVSFSESSLMLHHGHHEIVLLRPLGSVYRQNSKSTISDSQN